MAFILAEGPKDIGDLYLDIGEAYMEVGEYKAAEPILNELVQSESYRTMVRCQLSTLLIFSSNFFFYSKEGEYV